METLTKSLDPEVPVAVLDLPIGQLVLQVINGKQELTSVQEAQTGRLVRAGVPIASSIRRGEIDGVVVVDHPVGVDLVVPVEEEEGGDRRVEALPVAEVVLVDDPLVAEEDEGVRKSVYHSMTHDSIKLYKHTYSDENVFYIKKGMTYINTL